MLVITDITGKIIYKEKAKDKQITLNVSNWADGYYTFRYQTNNESLTQKFIKQ
jgi:hypothetical protein